MRRSTPLHRTIAWTWVGPYGRVSVVIHCTRDQWLRYSIEHEYRFSIRVCSRDDPWWNRRGKNCNKRRYLYRSKRKRNSNYAAQKYSLLFIGIVLHSQDAFWWVLLHACARWIACVCTKYVKIIAVWSAASRAVRFLLQLQILAYSHFHKCCRNHIIKSNTLWRAIIYRSTWESAHNGMYLTVVHATVGQ